MGFIFSLPLSLSLSLEERKKKKLIATVIHKRESDKNKYPNICWSREIIYVLNAAANENEGAVACQWSYEINQIMNQMNRPEGDAY